MLGYDAIIFALILDNPDVGLESNCVGTRNQATGNHGTDNKWYDIIDVEPDNYYLIRMYVHNNSPLGFDAVAENVKIFFNVPTIVGKLIEVNGILESSNSTPQSIWDNTFFRSDKDFCLSYVEGSAFLENNGIGSGGGIALSDRIVTADGVLLGYDELNGRIPGCFQYASYICILVKPIFIETGMNKGFLAEASIWKENEWKDTYLQAINAKIGEKIRFKILYKNLGNIPRDDITIRVSMPENLQLIPGTTVMINDNNPEGIRRDDNIASTGVNIGGYEPDHDGSVIFDAYVTDAKDWSVLAWVVDSGVDAKVKAETVVINVPSEDPFSPQTTRGGGKNASEETSSSEKLGFWSMDNPVIYIMVTILLAVIPVRKIFRKRAHQTKKTNAQHGINNITTDNHAYKDINEGNGADMKNEAILIITALEKELVALLDILSTPFSQNYKQMTQNGHTYYIYDIMENTQIVITSLNGMGSVNAALGAISAIDLWHPKQVYLAGICAGIEGRAAIGDIIISDQIIDYEMQKFTDSNKVIRWNVFRSDNTLNKELQSFNSKRWQLYLKEKFPNTINAPSVISAAILSGNKVIANKNEADVLSSFWDKACAIEMEASGISNAIHQSAYQPAFITVKGVCDLADSNKNDDWQEYAAMASASYILDFILSRTKLEVKELLQKSSKSTPAIKEEKSYRTSLLDIMSDQYNIETLKVLAFRLVIKWDNIEGSILDLKIAALIEQCEKKNKLKDLISQVNKDMDGALSTNDSLKEFL